MGLLAYSGRVLKPGLRRYVRKNWPESYHVAQALLELTAIFLPQVQG